jgi:hypothetical protein
MYLISRLVQKMLPFLLRLVKQPWADDFYNALAPMVAFTAVEVVIFRDGLMGKPEVLVGPRSKQDKYYRGMKHSLGTIFRPLDAPHYSEPGLAEKVLQEGSSFLFQKAFARILRELGLQAFDGEPKPVALFPQRTPRGTELAVIFVAKIKYEDNHAWTFYNAEDVVQYSEEYSLVPHHRAIIQIALAAYTNRFKM